MTKVESTTAELKEFIFQLLKHYKIASVSYRFSGSGDSGEFTDIEVNMEEGVEEVDIDEIYDDVKKAIKFEMINISNGNVHTKEGWVPNFLTEDEKFSLGDLIERYCYRVLEDAQPGWEIDYGSNGDVLLVTEENETSVQINVLTAEHHVYRY